MKAQSRTPEGGINPILNAIPTIISSQDLEESGRVLVGSARELAEKLKDLKMAQVRDIFDELRQIESLWMRDAKAALHRLHLLKPRLIYRTARKREWEPLARVLERAIEEVVSAGTDSAKHERFRRLMEFTEAIVAYHKAYGGE